MAPVEKAIRDAQKKYSPSQLVEIDSTIRQLATEHYKYKHLPLCIGKTRGIVNVLKCFYSVDVGFYYVWDVLETFHNEPKE